MAALAAASVGITAIPVVTATFLSSETNVARTTRRQCWLVSSAAKGPLAVSEQWSLITVLAMTNLVPASVRCELGKTSLIVSGLGSFFSSRMSTGTCLGFGLAFGLVLDGVGVGRACVGAGGGCDWATSRSFAEPPESCVTASAPPPPSTRAASSPPPTSSALRAPEVPPWPPPRGGGALGPPGNPGPAPSLGIGPVEVAPRSGGGGSGGACGGVPGGRIASGVSAGPGALEDVPAPNLAMARVRCPFAPSNVTFCSPSSGVGTPGCGTEVGLVASLDAAGAAVRSAVRAVPVAGPAAGTSCGEAPPYGGAPKPDGPDAGDGPVPACAPSREAGPDVGRPGAPKGGSSPGPGSSATVRSASGSSSGESSYDGDAYGLGPGGGKPGRSWGPASLATVCSAWGTPAP